MNKTLQTGFGLIEIMIGIVMGLFIMMSIYGSISFFEAIKRTTIGSNSANENAASAINAIEHDLKMAGLGFTSSNGISCSSLNAYYQGFVQSDGAPLAPVFITNGGTNPDTITIAYGSSIIGAAPAQVIVAMANSTSNLTVNNANGMAVGDQALVSAPGSALPCTLIGMTQIQTFLDDAVLAFANTSPYNPTLNTTFAAPATYPLGALVQDVGSFTWVIWRINGSNQLEMYDKIKNISTPVVDNIVQMKMQYGVTNGGSDAIAQWVSATGTWATLNAANIGQIRAVRIAVVARSPQPERPTSGGTCTTTTQAPTIWAGTTASVSSLPNWQCYRYRVQTTVFPLKNVLWGGH